MPSSADRICRGASEEIRKAAEEDMYLSIDLLIEIEGKYSWSHTNYGVPLETALANLRNTVLYHEAYDFYLAHTEEVERLLAEWEDDEPFVEEPDNT